MIPGKRSPTGELYITIATPPANALMQGGIAMTDDGVIYATNPSGGTSPPTNTVAPSISGNNTVGSTLTYAAGTWTGTPVPTLTHKWLSDGDDTGATGATYVVPESAAGSTITVVETATNSVASDTVTSNGIVIAAPTLGPELNPDPGFDSATGWTVQSTWQVSGGTANGVGIANLMSVFRPVALASGATYRFTMTIDSVNAVGIKFYSGSMNYNSPTFNTPGVHTWDGVVNGTSGNISIAGAGAGADAVVSSFSVREVL